MRAGAAGFFQGSGWDCGERSALRVLMRFQAEVGSYHVGHPAWGLL